MIDHKVEQLFDVLAVQFCEQLVKVGHRAEQRVDAAVI